MLNYLMQKNTILGILLVALGIFVLWQAALFPQLRVDLAVVNSAFMPRVIASLIILLALPLFFTRPDPRNRLNPALSPAGRMTTIFALLIAGFIIVLPWLRFELTSFLFLLCSMRFLGEKRIWLLAVLPLVVTTLVTLIFIHFMHVPLPSFLRDII